MHEYDVGDENFEKRVAAYLEMNPVIMIAALNEHAHAMNYGAFIQTIFFDLRCLTEALTRSELDISGLEIVNHKISLQGQTKPCYFSLVGRNRIELIHEATFVSRYGVRMGVS